MAYKYFFKILITSQTLVLISIYELLAAYQPLHYTFSSKYHGNLSNLEKHYYFFTFSMTFIYLLFMWACTGKQGNETTWDVPKGVSVSSHEMEVEAGPQRAPSKHLNLTNEGAQNRE